MKSESITKYSHCVDMLLANFIIYIINVSNCSNYKDLHEKIYKNKNKELKRHFGTTLKALTVVLYEHT